MRTRDHAALLDHGLLLLGLLLPLPNHYSHDDLPLLLCEVAEVRQIGHRGRRSGWARAAVGPHRGRHVFLVPWRTRVSVVKAAKARESRHGHRVHRRLTQALQPFHGGGTAAVAAFFTRIVLYSWSPTTLCPPSSLYPHFPVIGSPYLLRRMLLDNGIGVFTVRLEMMLMPDWRSRRRIRAALTVGWGASAADAAAVRETEQSMGPQPLGRAHPPHGDARTLIWEWGSPRARRLSSLVSNQRALVTRLLSASLRSPQPAYTRATPDYK